MQASKLIFKNDKSGNADDRRANGKHANSQRDGATCKRATVYVAQRRFPFIKGKGLGAFIRKHDLAWHISFSPWPPCSRHHW